MFFARYDEVLACRAQDRDMGSREESAEDCRLGVHNRWSAFNKNLFDRKGGDRGGDRASRTFTGVDMNLLQIRLRGNKLIICDRSGRPLFAIRSAKRRAKRSA